jgi:Zn-dependent alcohol dehydrogenase
LMRSALQGICHTDEYTRSGADPEVSTPIRFR